MKLYKKEFEINKEYIPLLPAIILNFHNPVYNVRSFAIEFRWLIFQARILWLDISGKERDEGRI